MIRSISTVSWSLCVLPLVLACGVPAQDASGYKTVHAYNKETGKYFDVRVPYHTTFGADGTVSEDPPSRGEVDSAVDKATWEAESRSRIDSYVNRGSSNAPGSAAPSRPGSGSSAWDQTTTGGSSYHDSDSPFAGEEGHGFP